MESLSEGMKSCFAVNSPMAEERDIRSASEPAETRSRSPIPVVPFASVAISAHSAKGINIVNDELGRLVSGRRNDGEVSPSSRFVQNLLSYGSDGRKTAHVIELTISDQTATKELPRQNRLVHACLEAYAGRHHFVLRPDDVWIAIMTQFSFYVNKDAEEMRSSFARERRKDLFIQTTLKDGINITRMVAEMADLVNEYVLDEEFQAWIIPSFSTTTKIDTIVCSAVMMGGMRQYFEYKFVPALFALI
ncbi:hypothetical protein B0H67DRAFT_554366 [Lasiosphaeris hirsuta]|uniref:Uncharacterized protein n=1 Tax=Lasiosphaeris hirsuta TaxID=260670 RepID=A0AA40DWA1_9PEZI|nr:hypothetical protein B0H67DRAFT_554366 [Lasiosphaeris hirsuta]